MIEATGRMCFDGKLEEVIKRIVPFIEYGFYVSNVTIYIDWPFFWSRIYTIELKCDLVIDGSECVALPSTEELIKELS